jgi:hypothetical protein
MAVSSRICKGSGEAWAARRQEVASRSTGLIVRSASTIKHFTTHGVPTQHCWVENISAENVGNHNQTNTTDIQPVPSALRCFDRCFDPCGTCRVTYNWSGEAPRCIRWIFLSAGCPASNQSTVRHVSERSQSHFKIYY